MAEPHSPHVLMVEAKRKKQGKSDDNFKSDCGLSLRGLHAICPFKDLEALAKQQISGRQPFKYGVDQDGYFDMLIAENRLGFDMLSKKIQDINAEPMPQWAVEYTHNKGAI